MFGMMSQVYAPYTFNAAGKPHRQGSYKVNDKPKNFSTKLMKGSRIGILPASGARSGAYSVSIPSQPGLSNSNPALLPPPPMFGWVPNCSKAMGSMAVLPPPGSSASANGITSESRTTEGDVLIVVTILTNWAAVICIH